MLSFLSYTLGLILGPILSFSMFQHANVEKLENQMVWGWGYSQLHIYKKHGDGISIVLVYHHSSHLHASTLILSWRDEVSFLTVFVLLQFIISLCKLNLSRTYTCTISFICMVWHIDLRAGVPVLVLVAAAINDDLYLLMLIDLCAAHDQQSVCGW